MKMIRSSLRLSFPRSCRIPFRLRVKNLLSTRAFLLVALCALVALAVFSETDVMRAQQVTSRAIVRHGFTTNGRIEGSVQQLMGENSTFNGSGVITGDLLVPGTPTVQLNGNPTFGGTVEGTGSAQPTNYKVTINGSAQLGRLVRRTDPIAMPTVAAPPATTGTRDVTLNNSSQSPGDFATLRDLTLNGSAGIRTVPAGTYRKFVANGGTGFILGVAGATEPAVYNFNSLLLNGSSQLQVVGPIVVTMATAVTLNASMGSVNNPLWLSLRVASGGLTLNGGGALYGIVTAPSGHVTINGNSSLIGNVICDRLTTNGSGMLRVLQQGDTTPPVVTVQQPAEGSITSATQVTVSGTFSDEGLTTVSVNGVAATVQGNNFTASVPVVEGQNSLLIVATDAAGNHTEFTRHVVRDTTSPVVTIQQPTANTVTTNSQVTVSGTFSDATATSITVNGIAATVSGNNFSAVVPLSEGSNTLHVVALDAAQNTNEATRSITLDTGAPAVVIAEPSVGITNQTQIDVTGTVTDATATTVSVNGVAATLSGNAFAATVPLTEGSNVLHVTATDAAGNLTAVDRNLMRDTIAPVVTIQSPADGTLTADTEAIVSGTFSDASPITITINGVVATLTQNSYTATVPLLDGPSLLIATAIDDAGNEAEVERKITKAAALTLNVEEPLEGQLAASGEIRVAGSVTGTDVQVTVNDLPLTMVGGVAFGGYTTLAEGTHTVRIKATDVLGRTEEIVRSVSVDTTAPAITEVVPAANQLVTETTTTISGRVSDATAVTVKVNDLDASVGQDGAFTFANFAVSEGANAVRVEAIDALGNNTIVDSVFLGKDRTAPEAPALFPVLAETRLQVQQVEGRAEPGSVVNVTGGVEPVTTDAADGTGLFFATVNLAVGNNVLTVASVDKEGNVSPPVSLPINSNPDLTRSPGQPFQISISTNDAQKGLVGQELPRPLIARVTDVAGDPVAGVPVTFTNTFGGGHFVGSAGEFVAATDNDGRASARYIGAQPGFQYIMANFAGNPTQPISFAAEVLKQIPNGQTTASGLVLDQNLRALPNVLVRLAGQQTRTGSDGRFLLTNVAFGPHQVLELVGRDQIPFPGRWPNISYDFDVLQGVENHLGRPLFLPRVNGGVQMPLDANNVITTDTTFELPVVGGLPPIRVTARAGTHVQFPPDVTDKRLSITRIPVNRTPMILEDGKATNLYISVQPSGAIFDAPLELSFPNLDSLPANSEVSLMSFDHDAGRYVQMGTGHVSADGNVVRSDPGSGIRVGAWHAMPPGPSGGGGPGGGGGPRPTTATVLSHVQVEGNPAFEGKDVEIREAVLDSVRGVPVSENNANGVLKKVALRFLIPKLSNDPPKLGEAVVTAKAAKPEIKIDGGAFDPKVKKDEVYLVKDKEIELTASATGMPTSDYKFYWSIKDQKKATLSQPEGATITIKGGDPDEGGDTEVTIEAKGSSGGAAKITFKVNLVKVTYKEEKANSGFDSLVRGAIADTSAGGAEYDNNGNFVQDNFITDPDEDKNKKAAAKDGPWLTVILNGDQNSPQPGGTSTAKYEVKPDKAKDHLIFESDTTSTATVTTDTQEKKLTATSQAAGECKVLAKLDQVYKTNGGEAGKLNVVVRKRVKVRAAFFYVKNSKDGYETTLDSGNLDAYLASVNQILTPQTGVEYVKFRVYHWQPNRNFNVPAGSTVNAHLSIDLGSVVNMDSDWKNLTVKLCDPDADREVYFTWDVEAGDSRPKNAAGKEIDLVAAAFGGQFNNGTVHGTIIHQSTLDQGVLAHEIGHSLQIKPEDTHYAYCRRPTRTTNGCTVDFAHSVVKRELMFKTTSGGNHIPKKDVDRAVQDTTDSDWFKGGYKRRPC